MRSGSVGQDLSWNLPELLGRRVRDDNLEYSFERRGNYLADWPGRFLLRNEAGHFRIARGRNHFRPRTRNRHVLNRMSVRSSARTESSR